MLSKLSELMAAHGPSTAKTIAWFVTLGITLYLAGNTLKTVQPTVIIRPSITIDSKSNTLSYSLSLINYSNSSALVRSYVPVFVGKNSVLTTDYNDAHLELMAYVSQTIPGEGVTFKNRLEQAGGRMRLRGGRKPNGFIRAGEKKTVYSIDLDLPENLETTELMELYQHLNEFGKSYSYIYLVGNDHFQHALVFQTIMLEATEETQLNTQSITRAVNALFLNRTNATTKIKRHYKNPYQQVEPSGEQT